MMFSFLAVVALVASPVPQECVDIVQAALSAPSVATSRPVWASGMPERIWRLADAASVEEDGDRRRCLFTAAENEAAAAVAGAPDDIGRRFALAVVIGLVADREGGRTKVRAASRLHVELTALLEIAPDHARARHLLGRLHAGVMRMDRITRWIATNLLGGGALKEASWAGAEEHLLFAEQASPEVFDHHYELARLYRETGREAQAMAEAGHVLKLPVASAMEADVRAKVERFLAESKH